MIIGERLRALREERHLSQRQVEKRTGMLCSYISRIECGHLTPSLETLEKFAQVFEIPMYQLLYEGEQPALRTPQKRTSTADTGWGSSGRDQILLLKFRRLLSHMRQTDRELLLYVADQMARSKSK